MTSPLHILLIQARSEGDPMAEHELEAFSARCELPTDAFDIFNVATDDRDDFDLQGFDAVMVGGSGDFSLVDGGFDWHGDFLDLMRHLLEASIPTFASCFGTLARDDDRAEIGTFTIRLTDAADDDPLFGDLPAEFDAQLGHNDSAVELSDELIHLAESHCCRYQAVRVRNRPIIATQFHPELTRDDNLDRFRNYLKNYKTPGQNFDEAMAYAEKIHRESPHSCGLLESFVRDLRHRKKRASGNSAAQ